jgi:hypothetical protein
LTRTRTLGAQLVGLGLGALCVHEAAAHLREELADNDLRQHLRRRRATESVDQVRRAGRCRVVVPAAQAGLMEPRALVAGLAVAIYLGQPAHAQRWCDFLRGARINSHGSTFSAPASRSSTVMVADTSARSIDPR